MYSLWRQVIEIQEYFLLHLSRSFVVCSEPLAIAVAAEWNAQKENIERSTMHLVGKYCIR